MRSSFAVPIAILVAGVILGGAVYFSLKTSTSTSSQSGNPALVRPVDAADHILGSPVARLVIIEYSDFDCPHCQTFHAALHQIVNDYGTTGDVAWVFRNFPLTEIHPNAKKHAEAAECAGRDAGSTAYWKFTDLLFTNQPGDPKRYAEFSKLSGADPNNVGTCIQNAGTNGVDARIDADRKNALESGARGTPYSILLMSGKSPVVIDGAWPYEDLRQAIASALSENK